MARVKLAYIGGGSTRAPGTVASFIRQSANFAGSEIVLVDLDEERLGLVRRLAERMIEAQGADLRVTATTDRARALPDCDGVLSSFRPGGFEARALDERLPLARGAIGQETQGAGGLFMALRALHVTRGLVEDMARLCPGATLFNYTNPVNIVAQGVADHSEVPVISLCEGPIVFPLELARMAGLDPRRVEATMVGLNHACWSVEARYDGEALLPRLERALEGVTDPWSRRLLHLAVTVGSIPASYMRYYFYEEDMLRELRARPTTRAQDILAEVPDYWAHYREQVDSENPTLDPARSRGGLFELELAVDVMDALFNDRGEVWPCNVVNRGAIQDFPDGQVVEVPCLVDRRGARPLSGFRVPAPVRGLLHALGEYQGLAADAGWCGSRRDALRALVSNPLVRTLPLAEALYDDLARAHRAYLPERLW
ncbi:glycoside hydrolase family protein [Deinococcus aerius]|uniref:Glycoside hydrolase family protein n=1 Tax=Deinococcus aerius TaxID=200253 RepID=A0A2I9DNA9_9DEIO|nr:glycoside hydrolase [Deinococcus aerius]GBF08088.1 glycoside hydrolase family protein [Deinococcus aerius]